MKHAKLGTINFACGCSADVSGIRPGIGDRVFAKPESSVHFLC